MAAPGPDLCSCSDTLRVACEAIAMACGSCHCSSAHGLLIEWLLGLAGAITVAILEGVWRLADRGRACEWVRCVHASMDALVPPIMPRRTNVTRGFGRSVQLPPRPTCFGYDG